MAYAAVVSLHQILDQIILQSDDDDHQIKTLRDKVRFLKLFLENIFPIPKSSKTKAKDLETRIRDAIYKAEDTIESYILSCKSCSGDEITELDLKQHLQSIDLMTVEAKAIMHTTKQNKDDDDLETSSYSSPAGDYVSSLIPDFSNKNKIVGLDDDIKKLKAQLMEDSDSRLKILPIVGMAGIGKTTLATALYDDSLIKDEFPTRAWVTVSQEYRLRDILLGLLGSLNKHDVKGSDEKLRQTLYYTLLDKRYLIVVDGMWDTKIGDKLRHHFPNQRLGSRIILTTRLSDVAIRANPSRLLHEMQFLNEENSWKLLCQNAFVDAWCPPELEKVGKKIVKKCEGLPSAIISIANILSKAENSLESWEKVAKHENLLALITEEEGSPMSEALYLSYNSLPSHLKECFLYFGVFPLSHEIFVSKLVKMWVGEGLIKSNHFETFEDTARKYVEELVSHNIVLIRQQSSSGRPKTCRAHYFFWHLCVEEAANQKIFHLINSYPTAFLEGIQCQHRLCIHRNALLGLKHVSESIESVSNLRSFLGTGPKHQYPVSICPGSKFMRVLDALTIRLYEFPIRVLELVLLKYLAFTYDGKLPSSISRLKNLRYLIVHRYHLKIINSSPSYMPREIWNMKELRHLQVMGSDLPYPDDGAQLPNLLTLLGVSDRSCTKEVLQSIPNLEKLGVHIVLPHGVSETLHIFDHLALLPRLKSFKCIMSNPNPRSQHVLLLPESIFPSSLTKLTLSGCGCAWEDMSMIGHALKNLRVLKLRCYAFQGPKWVLDKEDFPKLKHLLLEDIDLVHWVFGEGCFTQLSFLIIRHCYKLEEIPYELVYNLARLVIELVDCSPSTLASAKQIQGESCGSIQMQVYSSLNDKRHKPSPAP